MMLPPKSFHRVAVADDVFCPIGKRYFQDKAYMNFLWSQQRKRDEQSIINNMGARI